MKIIESFVRGKMEDQNLCEDSIFVSDDFIAVIDGASSRTRAKYDGKNPGRFAMENIRDALAKLSYDVDAKTAINQITKHISNIYKNLSLFDRLKESPDERPTAAMIVYSRHRNELWMVEDCQALVDGKHILNEKNIDKLVAEMRSCYLQQEIALGKTIEELIAHDTGREFIWPILSRQSIFQNKLPRNEYSFGTLDGFDVCEDDIIILDLTDVQNVVIASDGYPKIFSTLKETEEYLFKVIEEDPLCYKTNKCAKAILEGYSSFDDRSYIRFSI